MASLGQVCWCSAQADMPWHGLERVQQGQAPVRLALPSVAVPASAGGLWLLLYHSWCSMNRVSVTPSSKLGIQISLSCCRYLSAQASPTQTTGTGLPQLTRTPSPSPWCTRHSGWQQVCAQ